MARINEHLWKANILFQSSFKLTALLLMMSSFLSLNGAALISTLRDDSIVEVEIFSCFLTVVERLNKVRSDKITCLYLQKTACSIWQELRLESSWYNLLALSQVRVYMKNQFNIYT